jgi:hypothetical protein
MIFYQRRWIILHIIYFAVIVGKQELLRSSDNGSFTVMDQFSLGSLYIVHQSPGRVFLRSGCVIPIYCIASGHTLAHTYRWKRGSINLHGNSPVLWIDKAGPYVCNVTHSSDNTQTASQVSVVEGNIAE